MSVLHAYHPASSAGAGGLNGPRGRHGGDGASPEGEVGGRRTRVLLWAAALGSVLGCASAEECRLSSDCAAPLLCVDGLCVGECREDRDCRAGEVCRSARCRVREDGQRLCARAEECEVGETCSGGVCAPVRFVTPDAGVPDAGEERSDAGAVDAGAPGLPYGAVCSRGPDCASRFCLGVAGATMGRCTARCEANVDCVHPDQCLEIPGAGRLCGQATTGRPAGAPCPNGPSECATGLCVDTPASGPICTQPCSPLPSCPPGLTCQPVADGAGGALAVCLEGTGKGFGETCAADDECASSLCVAVGGAGVCTSLCAQIPCPGGWACTLAEAADGARLRVCAPEGAVGGGFGDPCTGASSCASGLCLYDARTGGAFCTERCLSAADCRGVPGLACVNLSSGARVCGPP